MRFSTGISHVALLCALVGGPLSGVATAGSGNRHAKVYRENRSGSSSRTSLASGRAGASHSEAASPRSGSVLRALSRKLPEGHVHFPVRKSSMSALSTKIHEQSTPADEPEIPTIPQKFLQEHAETAQLAGPGSRSLHVGDKGVIFADQVRVQQQQPTLSSSSMPSLQRANAQDGSMSRSFTADSVPKLERELSGSRQGLGLGLPSALSSGTVHFRAVANLREKEHAGSRLAHGRKPKGDKIAASIGLMRFYPRRTLSMGSYKSVEMATDYAASGAELDFTETLHLPLSSLVQPECLGFPDARPLGTKRSPERSARSIELETMQTAPPMLPPVLADSGAADRRRRDSLPPPPRRKRASRCVSMAESINEPFHEPAAAVIDIPDEEEEIRAPFTDNFGF